MYAGNTKLNGVRNDLHTIKQDDTGVGYFIYSRSTASAAPIWAAVVSDAAQAASAEDAAYAPVDNL